LSGAGIPFGNLVDGLTISAPNSTVRGLIINSWDQAVFFGSGSDNNKVQGNFIGTDAPGMQELGNLYAVAINSANNTVGGTARSARNLISGNDVGVYVSGTGNRVQGNLIGTKASGTQPLGNRISVNISGSNNTIGGTVPTAGNVISGNDNEGVSIGAQGPSAAKGNRILSNSIYNNGKLGINLFSPSDPANGVTANDNGPPPDTDTGPNNLQNFPVISEALTEGTSTTVTGSLKSTPNKTFTLQFFFSPFMDPSGFGEGKKFIGQKTVTTNTNGNVSFTFTPAQRLEQGGVVTATATDPSGNTSEFSRASTVFEKF
jgi:hypothetical protein